MTSALLLPQLQRAQALHGAGRPGEAWSILSPLRAAMDNQGQALRLYALVAQAAGKVDEAIEALKRIAQLEREPPEIIGALADTLGRAGRHDEALGYWDSLAARHPEIADAHLNRAVTATEAGRHDLAIEAADLGLKRFPGHARLLAAKAMALKNAGRMAESLIVFEAAVAADPNRALTRHNQAVALRAACRFDEACESYATSERLGMRGAQFYANWAAAALEAGRVEESAELYARALAADPAHTESRKALTRLDIEYRGGSRAFDHYEKSLRDRGSQVADWIDWTNALLSHNRFAEAEQTARRALSEYPGNVALEAMAAFGAGMIDDAAEQLQRIEDAYQGAGSPPLPWMSLLAMRAGMPDRSANYAERMTAMDPTNQGAWSTLSIAWRLLNDPREHWLCNYDELVMETDVPSPDGSVSPEAYSIEVAAALDPLHQTRAAPGDQSLREGTQTSGELFQRPEPAIQRFRDAVRMAAERRIAQLPDDPAHPFLSRKSARLGFSGSWSVRLNAGGGHHVSHYHDQGWMSSAYYARLPKADDGARARNEGWIQFGAPPAMFGVELEPRRIIEPKVGKLVLFPSYMLHGTIPFATGDRLTAAFDYQPL